MFIVRADVSFDVYLIARPTSEAARDVCSGVDLLSHNSWNLSSCQIVTWRSWFLDLIWLKAEPKSEEQEERLVAYSGVFRSKGCCKGSRSYPSSGDTPLLADGLRECYSIFLGNSVLLVLLKDACCLLPIFFLCPLFSHFLFPLPHLCFFPVLKKWFKVGFVVGDSHACFLLLKMKPKSPVVRVLKP